MPSPTAPTLALFLLTVLSRTCTCSPDGFGDRHETGSDEPAFIDPDGATVTVDATGRLTFTDAKGIERTATIALGFVSNNADTVNFDPYNLKDPDLEDAIPLGLRWETPESAEWSGAYDAVLTDGSSGSYDVALTDGTPVTFYITTAGPGISVHVAQAGVVEEWAPYVRVTMDLDPTEGLYGLGEIFSAVEHRGTYHAMQFELWGDIESANNEAHVPVPLLVSSAGWGFLANSFRPGVFDVGWADPNVIEVTYNQTIAEGFTFEVYGPGTGAAVTARYHQRTGAPEVPPTWAFAPLQWENEVEGSDTIYANMDAIRSNGIPTGLIWVDNPWQTTYNSMIAEPTMFPDWAGLVDDMHDQGFRVMAWSTPYLEEDEPDYDLYTSNSWFVDTTILLNPFGEWVDLTNDDAMAAWQARVGAAADLGLEGWKLDYGEDTQIGLGASRLSSVFDNGEDERTMHHKYAAYFHHAYADPYPTEADGTKAGFILGRAGVLGGHTVTDCIWPGDLDNDFAFFSREAGVVGGLASAIRGGTSLAASGYPFFASDTGGYRGGRPGKEVMIRWTEYSATLPIMQYGGAGSNHNPWDFTAYDDDGPSQFDEETLESFKRYAILHIRLFPYFWKLAQLARNHGLPPVQALGLAYPDLGVHPHNAYLVGDDLYVAPVEEEGHTTRTLYLPDGDWVHWWTGERYAGPGEITIDAPLGVGPLFQRAGSAIPMLRRTVQTLSPTDGSVDSWADDPGVLNARIVPGEGAQFTLETGEAVTAAEDIQLTAGSLYSGWDLEIYAPGATAATVDGVALPTGEEGCQECVILGDPWIRVVTGGERVTVSY